MFLERALCKINKRIKYNINIVTIPNGKKTLVYVVNPSYYNWNFNEVTGIFADAYNGRSFNRVSYHFHQILFCQYLRGAEVIPPHQTCTTMYLKGVKYILTYIWISLIAESWVPFIYLLIYL